MTTAQPTDETVIAWFSELSLGNQITAGVNPEKWAEAHATGDKADMYDELVRRARVWRAYMQDLMKED